MPKFRKKPVVIEAVQFNNHEDYMAVCAWMREWGDDPCALVAYSTPDMFINTPEEGRLQVELGDWIIRDVNGKYYPCKPGIFENTYEPVRERAAWHDRRLAQMRARE